VFHNPQIYPATSSTSILTQQRIEGDTIASLCKHARASANPEAALVAPRKAFMEVKGSAGVRADLRPNAYAFVFDDVCIHVHSHAINYRTRFYFFLA